jgi:uncharacterized membrane protein YdbT with pleckstrin-like domain
MSQYVDKSLAVGETILMRGRWPAIYWIMACAALVILGVLVVGAVIFLMAAIHMWNTEFAVTDQRVLLKRGWIARHTQELAVSNIEEVRLDQGLFGLLFGFGRVVVTGTGEAIIHFPPMADPIDFRRAIETARAHARAVR